MYQRISIHTIDDLILFYNSKLTIFNGISVNQSVRYSVFATKGVTCAICGLVGEYAALERHKDVLHPAYHFNVYNGDTMITVDDKFIAEQLFGLKILPMKAYVSHEDGCPMVHVPEDWNKNSLSYVYVKECVCDNGVEGKTYYEKQLDYFGHITSCLEPIPNYSSYIQDAFEIITKLMSMGLKSAIQTHADNIVVFTIYDSNTFYDYQNEEYEGKESILQSAFANAIVQGTIKYLRSTNVKEI